LVDDAFTKNLSVYESILDDLSSTEVKDLAALLDKLLKRMDHLSRMREPWTTS
jgi:galactose-1-phosphate uridylyltransferase